MSKILNRPMFRGGGRVNSRGTGITSNLQYNNGGRVGYQAGNFVTGGQLLEQARTGIQFAPNIRPLSGALYAPQTLFPGGQAPSSIFINPLYEGVTQVGNEPADVSVGAPMQYTPYSGEEVKAGVAPGESDYEAGGEMDIARLTPKKKEDKQKTKIELPTKKETGDINQVTVEDADESISERRKRLEKKAKEYEAILGQDARKEAIFDALLAASPQFFRGKNLREAAPGVLEAIREPLSKPSDIKMAAKKLALEEDIAMRKAQAQYKPSAFSEQLGIYRKAYPGRTDAQLLEMIRTGKAKDPQRLKLEYVSTYGKTQGPIKFAKDTYGDEADFGGVIGEVTPVSGKKYYDPQSDAFYIFDEKGTPKPTTPPGE